MKSKDKGYTNFYESCDLTEKVYLKRAIVGMRVKAIRLSIVGWRLICFWWLDLFYTACVALLLKKLVFAVFIINTAIIHMYSLYYYCNCIVVVYHYNYPARQLI